MGTRSIDITIIGAVIFAAVYFPAHRGIPCLAEEPPMNMALVEEFLSGKADTQKAHDVMDQLQSRIKKDPLNYTNYSALAFVCDYAGLYDKALDAIKSEIRYSPEKSEWNIVYGNLAREYLNIEKIDNVRKPAIKSLKFNPKDINSHMHLLSYYILKARYKEAASEFKILSGLDRNADFYYDVYARYFDKFRNKIDMIELFREAVKADPHNHLAHRILGTAIRDASFNDMEKNMPLVMKCFYKALELNPEYVPTHISIANTYMYLGLITGNKLYFNDSLGWLDKAYKLEPENAKVAYSMGNIFLIMEQYDKGIEKLEYAFYHGANDKDTAKLLAAAYNNKAYSYYEIGKSIKEGLKLIDKAILLDPDSGLIMSTKAELLYKIKKFKEAYECIQKAMKLAPDEPGIKQDLANIEKAMKK